MSRPHPFIEAPAGLAAVSLRPSGRSTLAPALGFVALRAAGGALTRAAGIRPVLGSARPARRWDGAGEGRVHNHSPRTVLGVFAHVLRVRGVEFKVLDPVVRPVAVDVVDHFAGIKGAAKMQLHDHPVLADAVVVANALREGVVGGGYHGDVAAISQRAATLPPRGIAPAHPLRTLSPLGFGEFGRARPVLSVAPCNQLVSARFRARRALGRVDRSAHKAGFRSSSHASIVTQGWA
jgi:hypothetical protein